MRRVINGKVYDTQTADTVVNLDNDLSGSDFNFQRISLYRTKKGVFFIAGTTGAFGRFCVMEDDGSRSDGSGIDVITKDEAREIAENAQTDVDVMEQHFGPLVEA